MEWVLLFLIGFLFLKQLMLREFTGKGRTILERAATLSVYALLAALFILLACEFWWPVYIGTGAGDSRPTGGAFFINFVDTILRTRTLVETSGMEKLAILSSCVVEFALLLLSWLDPRKAR